MPLYITSFQSSPVKICKYSKLKLYSNPARGILDFCKQSFFRFLLCSKWTIPWYSILRSGYAVLFNLLECCAISQCIKLCQSGLSNDQVCCQGSKSCSHQLWRTRPRNMCKPKKGPPYHPALAEIPAPDGSQDVMSRNNWTIQPVRFKPICPIAGRTWVGQRER